MDFSAKNSVENDFSQCWQEIKFKYEYADENGKGHKTSTHTQSIESFARIQLYTNLHWTRVDDFGPFGVECVRWFETARATKAEQKKTAQKSKNTR